ncbi:MAG: histidinol-phosphatase HisJ family protein [Thermodesulfobacteriota bacterium]
MTSPLIDITTDGHVHTRLCHHAHGEMEEYVDAAIAVGLRKIIFLEHYETGISYFESTWLTDENFVWYLEEGRRLADKYRDRIRVGVGVEVGANPDRLEETVKFLGRHRWERIGLSYHYLREGEQFVNVVSRRPANLELMEKIGYDHVADRYFAGLEKALAVIPATVVCHLDAVLRHCPDFSFAPRHHAAMGSILAKMRRKGVALEINTSGFSLRGEQFPALPVIRRAVAMGIELFAGSDAHRPADVGRFFGRLPAMLAGVAAMPG